MRVLFLVPDLFRESGGIARYCRLMYKAMSSSVEISQVDVVSLLDSKSDRPIELATNSIYHACTGSKARFTRSVISLAMHHYDILVVGHVNLMPLAKIVSSISQLPIMVMAYGVDVWDRLPAYRRLPLRSSDMVIAISEYTRSRMIESNSVKPEKTRILYNCFDPNMLEVLGADYKSDVDISSPNLLTVSRLSRGDSYKGHAQVIRALPYVLQSFPNLNYYIVGKGVLSTELASLASELGVKSNVHFLGFLDNPSLQSVYNHCDIFIMPSMKEGFGFVFAEAMMYGKPVIAGNQDASVEVVQHNETGILVDPRDTKQIAEAILLMLSNEDMRKRMGNQGLTVAKEKFNFSKFSNSLVKYIHEVVKGQISASV